MKSVLLIVCVLVFGLGGCPAVDAAVVALPASDQDAIRQAALNYANGWYSGDRARMESSLHDKLAKRAYLANKQGERYLLDMDKAYLLNGNQPENRQRYADASKRAEVEILDGFGNAATVKLRMDDWVDYMHVVRTEAGDWRIVNVLWELTPGDGQ